MSRRHLQADELIDLAEGTRAESEAPHLQTCDACRRQLTDLRATLGIAAADVDVPEPSPLFWDHLSARVHEAIAADRPGSRAPWLGGTLSHALPIWAGALVALVFAVVLTMRMSTPAEAPMLQPRPSPIADATAAPPSSGTDDPALALMADLVGEMNEDDASALALTTHPAYADDLAGGLSIGEREELQRLIAAEMKHSGG